jgi:hypothetical protein
MDMNDTDQRNALARLPKWAQTHIADLEREVAEKTRRIGQLSEGPADSNVCIADYGYPDRPLGRNVRVAFTLDEATAGRRADTVTVEHSREQPGTLEIHVSSDRSSQTLYISPIVSNHIRLSAGPV